MYRREEFLETDTAMVNEALCKLLCHNLALLIHESHELALIRRSG
jgi:hypothetical protein